VTAPAPAGHSDDEHMPIHRRRSGRRFSQGEGIYCGKPIARAGEAWCAEHRAIVYEPIRPAAVKRRF
jgi:hypothetical protein